MKPELWGFSLHSFAHPIALALLAVPVLLTVGYVLALLRRRARALVFGNLPVLAQVTRHPGERFRHVPAALLVLALVAFIVAIAGPMTEKREPRNRATVLLVMDTSLSMKAEDVAPTRIDAARAAAVEFAESLPETLNLGLISFAGTATPLVAPTTDRRPVIAAIEALTLHERTATGEAIYAALQSISTFSEKTDGPEGPPPAHIILLSDGKQTVPRRESDERGAYTAADRAKEQGIPVSTISFGTTEGTVVIDDTTAPVPVDDASLAEIARRSGGRFFTASSREQLSAVYDTLEEQIGWELVWGDASRPWLILGTFLLVVSAAGSIAVNRRLP